MIRMIFAAALLALAVSVSAQSKIYAVSSIKTVNQSTEKEDVTKFDNLRYRVSFDFEGPDGTIAIGPDISFPAIFLEEKTLPGSGRTYAHFQGTGDYKDWEAKLWKDKPNPILELHKPNYHYKYTLRELESPSFD